MQLFCPGGLCDHKGGDQETRRNSEAEKCRDLGGMTNFSIRVRGEHRPIASPVDHRLDEKLITQNLLAVHAFAQILLIVMISFFALNFQSEIVLIQSNYSHLI
jgi:hypothetical protein